MSEEDERVNVEVNPKERLYLFLMVVATIVIYVLLAISVVGLFSLLGLAVATFIAQGVFVGTLRGNALRVTERHFPEVYRFVEDYSRKLDLEYIPRVYVLESGGLLNAFVTKFLGRNFMVINSDVLELAYEEGESAVAFIVAHELAHIKRRHLVWRHLIYPALFVPFLGTAYLRACEYTCDGIAAKLEPKGAIPGLTLLTAGKKLYRRVDLREIVKQAEGERGFWFWLSEKLATHPHLIERIKNLYFNNDAVMEIDSFTKGLSA